MQDAARAVREVREEEEREEKESVQGVEVAKHYIFPRFCGCGGPKVGSIKRWVRSHLVEGEIDKLHAAVAPANLEVERLSTPRLRATLGS